METAWSIWLTAGGSSLAGVVRPAHRGRVAPGGCPPGAPTDPYVLALEHTAPQIIHSRQGTPRGCRSAIRRRFVDTFPDFDASDVCPSGGRMIRRPASLHA